MARLRDTIAALIGYYNHRRYHEGLGDIIPYDLYAGRHLEITQKRKEVKSKTLKGREEYNGAAREQGNTRQASID